MKSAGPKITGLVGNFGNWRISKKLPAAFVFFALAVGISVGIASDFIGSSTVEKEVSLKLETALAGRVQGLENYFGSIREDLGIVAASPTTKEALKEFTSAWNSFGGARTQTLQNLYINKNPNPTGEKDRLYDAGDGSAYSAVHARFHPWFHKLQQDREYYDVFLFDTEGNLVYTVFKEPDYATNMLHGQWADTDLANVFRDAAANLRSGYESFYDFQPYAPSADAPASFISTPVLDTDGTPLGVLAFQMPIGRINAIMGDVEGMGESGESYIVGSDYLMRSDSRFSEESTILKRTIDGATVKAAIAGRSGVEEIEDYRGVPVMSAYRPFEFLGTKWALLAEIDIEELNQPIVAMRSTLLMVSTAVIVVIGLLGFLVARGIARPIGELTGVMSILADGNNDVAIPHSDRGDEIGQMATTVDVFKHNAIARKRAEQALRRSELRYRHLIDSAEVSIWDENFTAVFDALERLRDEGVEDLGRHLGENPHLVRELATLVGISGVNRATLKLFGAASEKQFISSIDGIFTGKSDQVFADELCAIWDSQDYFRSEASLLTLAGKEIDVVISMPVPKTRLQARSVPVSIFDITERKTAESAREKTNQLLGQISKIQDEFIAGADSSKIFDGLLSALLSCTESEYGIIGEILHDDAGKLFLKTSAITNFSWDDEAQAFYDTNAAPGLEFRNQESILGKVIKTGELYISNDPSNDPNRCGLPKGHPALNSFLGIPFIKDGDFIGMAGIANRPGGYDQDVIGSVRPIIATMTNQIQAWRTEKQRQSVEQALKESEDQLRQAQKMEAIGLLTGGVAHDFNNILAIILGNLELLEEKISGKEEYAQLVTTGISAAERGAKLTQQLLTFSRKQMLRPRTTDLNELVVELTGPIRRTVGETIHVTTELESGLWPARIDRNQLSSALLNLAINSRDAMATGGDLVIRTANRRLGEEEARIHDDLEPGAYVSVSVSDTGTGMTPDVRNQAFDPFFTTRDFGESTGLGLSTVHGFAKQSGGDVILTSEQGVGTTVELLFPMLEDTMTPPRQPGGANSRPG